MSGRVIFFLFRKSNNIDTCLEQYCIHVHVYVGKIENKKREAIIESKKPEANEKDYMHVHFQLYPQIIAPFLLYCLNASILDAWSFAGIVKILKSMNSTSD